MVLESCVQPVPRLTLCDEQRTSDNPGDKGDPPKKMNASIVHRYQIAQTHRLSSQLQVLRGDLKIAHVSLTEAIDLFERTGMRRELAKAREELTRLEAQMAAAAE